MAWSQTLACPNTSAEGIGIFRQGLPVVESDSTRHPAAARAAVDETCGATACDKFSSSDLPKPSNVEMTCV
jgi:hypothetical protein